MCYKPGHPMPSLISTFGKYSGLLIKNTLSLVQFPHFQNTMCYPSGYFVPRVSTFGKQDATLSLEFPHLENKMCYKPGYPMPSLISTLENTVVYSSEYPIPSSISPFSKHSFLQATLSLISHLENKMAINQATLCWFNFHLENTVVYSSRIPYP
ncbi:hypothetical protein CEXT_719921 [Caerostris extrusa]|uniref:Uncharacterized protein n=1 Tax=Caerostris extrusa TaxID=172846 RepID=A0AAV4XBW7_CAEEX|nr:hypothetical protein CEXT_719921 [Caerostris extrusa]